MSEHVILTAIGSDRPGLVDQVSQYLFERGGNIEDSRMVNLRGQFAIMVLVGGEPVTIERINAQLPDLAHRTGLRVEVHAARRAPLAPGEAMPYRLIATAIDQPGLVHRFSHLLSGLGINIESLETRLTPAPYTGAPMFEMELILSVPRRTPLADLRQRLTGLCDELNVDFQLSAV
jgi:glycine cleavage system transcriptional repressor